MENSLGAGLSRRILSERNQHRRSDSLEKKQVPALGSLLRPLPAKTTIARNFHFRDATRQKTINGIPLKARRRNQRSAANYHKEVSRPRRSFLPRRSGGPKRFESVQRRSSASDPHRDPSSRSRKWFTATRVCVASPLDRKAFGSTGRGGRESGDTGGGGVAARKRGGRGGGTEKIHG